VKKIHSFILLGIVIFISPLFFSGSVFAACEGPGTIVGGSGCSTTGCTDSTFCCNGRYLIRCTYGCNQGTVLTTGLGECLSASGQGAGAGAGAGAGVGTGVGVGAGSNELTGPIGGCIMGRDVKVSGCSTAGQECNFDTNTKCGICCVLNTLYNVTNWMFIISVALSGIFIMLGAFQILMAGGNSENVDKGRHYITYAAIGLIAGLLSKAIPAVVRMAVGA